jgi:deoxyribonuclease V
VLLFTDVHYPEGGGARVAGVGASAWEQAAPSAERVVWCDDVAAYEPGAFYRRELPALLVLLGAWGERPEVVIVDGHAWLDGRPGLGARLHEATGIDVVGVAKKAFHGGEALPLQRGGSERPLYVSAAGGITAERARALVASMHGPHRLPTLLKLADRLCRDGDVIAGRAPPSGR